MVVVTAASVGMLDTTLAPRPDDTPGDALGCYLASGFDPNASYLDNLLSSARSSRLLQSCLSGTPAYPWKGLAATALLLAVAGVVYWWLPRRRERSTTPLETVDADGALGHELAALCERAGIETLPRFRVNPRRTTAGAVVWGRTGRYTVCLDAGLLPRRVTDPELFRAVVLHELAHLRRRDVDFAYSSTALWRVFVVLALAPYLVHEGDLLVSGLAGTKSPFWPGAASIIGYDLLTGLLLVGLVHLTRADLLRRRELHADALAVAWGASREAWNRQDRRPGSRLRALLRTHPDWTERRRTLDDPARLSPTGALPMFLLGTAAAVLVDEVVVFPGLSSASEAAWCTAAFVAPVLCYLLRPAVRPRSGAALGAGLWLGLGLLAGQLLTGANTGNQWGLKEPAFLLALLPIAVVPTVWYAQCARLVTHLPARWARAGATLLIGLVTLVLLWGGLRWWQTEGRWESVGLFTLSGLERGMMQHTFPGPWSHYAFELRAASTTFFPLAILNDSTLFSVALAATALIPLLLHLNARRFGRSTHLRVPHTLLAGVAGALLCCFGFLAASYALHTGRPATLHQRFGAFQFIDLWWLLTILTVVCSLTAAVVAAVSRRHWMLRALLAAEVTQLLGYGALWVLTSADGCVGRFDVIGSRCHWLPENGSTLTELIARQTLTTAVLFAACAALVGRGLARVLRRRRPHVPHQAPPSDASLGFWPAALGQSTALAMVVPVLTLALAVQGHGASGSAGSGGGLDQLVGLIDAPPAARNAKIRQWQAIAWVRKGGLARFEGLANAQDALGKAINQAAAEKPGPDGEITLDSAVFTRLCTVLGQQAQAALRYFPFPDPRLEANWSDALKRIDGDSRVCRAAFADNPAPAASQERLFNQFLTDEPEAMGALVSALKDIQGRVAG